MKKSLTIAICTAVFATQAFAAYVVVLKDGTMYKAKAKYTIVNGKAMVRLENGQSLQLDPNLIDVAKSERQTQLGTADAKIISLDPNLPAPTTSTANQTPSLSGIRLRNAQRPEETTTPPPPPSRSAGTPAPAPAVPVTGGRALGADVIDKFDRAFENVGIFEKKVVATGPNSIRAELTADTEERVFNAISATSFLMFRNAGVDGVRIEMVELFMKTTNGGAAGRFQMNRADAEALEKKTLSQREYFVSKVIF
ncbi:MAG TPA: hypothetical protein VGF48_16320 [Thermoanaerobaculia bacterium]|jgi:hypothetical protein